MSSSQYSLADVFLALENFSPKKSALGKLDLTTKMIGRMSRFARSVQPLITQAAKLEQAADKVQDNYFGVDGAVPTAVEAMVDSYNTTYDALTRATTSPYNMAVKLRTFAEAIGMDKETFTVKNEQLNFTINVHVELDADEMAKTMSDKTKLGKNTLMKAAAAS